MDYSRIYQSLVQRAKSRSASNLSYYEKHHIIPKCQGGTNSPDNLVSLTAREHFIAHLCLVKMYPGHLGLAKAAMMMTVCKSDLQKRINNRLYSWVKEKHAEAMSQSSQGSKNSQYGKCWIFNIELNKERKIHPKELDHYLLNGWKKGRINTIIQKCVVCDKPFTITHKKKTCSSDCFKKIKFSNKVFQGREKEFINLYRELGSMNKALKAMGFPGAVSHYYQWAKTLIKE